jgi:thioredoxin reductase (NADPH)
VWLRDTVTGQEEDAALAGLFVYVGLQPNTELLAGLVELDGGGHVPVNAWMETAAPGVYAVGDLRQHSAAQLVSAAGDGATAAIAAFRYVRGRKW